MPESTYYNIRIRRDSAVNWSTVNPILKLGEIGIITGTSPQQLKFGDGTTAWNTLPTLYFLGQSIELTLSSYVKKSELKQSVGEDTEMPMSQKAVTDLFNTGLLRLDPIANPDYVDPTNVQYPRDYVWPTYDPGRASYYLSAALGWNLDYRLAQLESGFNLSSAQNGQVPVFDAATGKFVPKLLALQNLVDVDILTDVPEDGNSLVYSSSLNKWVPGVAASFGNVVIDSAYLANGQVLTYVVPEDPSQAPYWTNKPSQGGGGESWGTVVIDQGTLAAGQTLVYTIPQSGEPYWTNASTGTSWGVVNINQSTLAEGQALVYKTPVGEDPYWTNETVGSSFGTVVIDDSTLAPGQLLGYVESEGSTYWTNVPSGLSLSNGVTDPEEVVYSGIKKLVLDGATFQYDSLIPDVLTVLGMGSDIFTKIEDSGSTFAKANYDLLIDDGTGSETNVNISEILRHIRLAQDSSTGNYYISFDLGIASDSFVSAYGYGEDALTIVLSLGDLVDVSLSSPVSDKELLIYDSATTHWVNGTLSLDDLSNISIGSAKVLAVGDVLYWNGAAWVNENITGGESAGTTTYLSSLADVTVPQPLLPGAILMSQDTSGGGTQFVVAQASYASNGIITSAEFLKNTTTNVLVAQMDLGILDDSANEVNITNILKHFSVATYNDQDYIKVDVGIASDSFVSAFGLSAGGGGGATSLHALDDVSLATPYVNGQVLTYVAPEGDEPYWTNLTLNISSLANVSDTAPLDGQILKFDGVDGNLWKPSNNTVSGLSDVDLTGIQNNYVLKWDSSLSKWIPTAMSGGDGTTYAEGDGISISSDATPKISVKLASGSGLYLSSSGLKVLASTNSGITVSGSSLILNLSSVGGLSVDSDGVYINAPRNSNITTLVDGGSDANQNYKVQRDRNGRLFVNVPWQGGGGTSTVYAAGAGLTSSQSGSTVTFSVVAATQDNFGGIKIGYTQSGKNYPVQLSSGKAYVNVPWSDTTYSAGTGISLSGTTISLSAATTSALGGMKPAAVRTTSPSLTTGKTDANRYYGVEFTSGNVAFVNVPWTSVSYTAGSGISISSSNEISIASTGVTNAMLAGNIANSKLANSSITIAGTQVSLGGSITASAIRDAMDLSGYMPKTGGTFTGNVEVGTTSSNKTFQVHGTTTLDKALTVGSGSSRVTSSFWGTQSSSTPAITLYGAASASSYKSVSLYVDGNTVLNTTGSVKVTGNVQATGAVVAAVASDARLKDDVQLIKPESAIFKLMALRPVSFHWNSKANELAGFSGQSFGFIAQEFVTVFPDSSRKMWGEYLGIDYNVVIPYLTAGWRSHESRITSLEERVNRLENYSCRY